jgi:hypothetical protein
MLYSLVFNMPVETGLKLMTPVGLTVLIRKGNLSIT